MPSISELGEVPPPVEAISWDRREFPSPDAEWRLVFHGPFEWHMGATGWELALSRNGKADREAQTRLSEIGKGTGFRCPPDTVPWSHLGDALALITWEDPAVILFVVAQTSVRRVLSPGFPFSVKWASDRDLLLLPYVDRGELIGPNGAVLVKTNWTLAEYEHPHVFWTEPAEHFLLVSRPSRRSMTRLTLFSSVDGREETSFAIDPADLLKYDHRGTRRSIGIGLASSSIRQRDRWAPCLTSGTPRGLTPRLALCGSRPTGPSESRTWIRTSSCAK